MRQVPVTPYFASAKRIELSIYHFICQADAQVLILRLKKNVRVAILRQHFSD